MKIAPHTRTPCAVALCCLGVYTGAAVGSDYWSMELPVMDGATDVVRNRDANRASFGVSYTIVLTDNEAPLRFYGPFFEERGWEHHLRDTYKRFPNQFQAPPMEKWSGFSTSTTEGVFGISFGAAWQNAKIKSNAAVQMRVTSIDEQRLRAKIDVLVGPALDGSAFIELIQTAQKDPKALLRLAQLAGGDPFKVDQIDLERVRASQTNDPLFVRYIQAVKSIETQIEAFARATSIPGR